MHDSSRWYISLTALWCLGNTTGLVDRSLEVLLHETQVLLTFFEGGINDHTMTQA